MRAETREIDADQASTTDADRLLRRMAAALSFGCAAIHAVVVAPHLREYAPYGWFFLLVTIFQVAWGLAVLRGASRPVFLLGATVNLLVALLWALSRTAGLPLGPDPGVPEAIGMRDVVSTTFELVVASVSAAALGGALRPIRRIRALALTVAVVVAVTALTAFAIASPEPGGGTGAGTQMTPANG